MTTGVGERTIGLEELLAMQRAKNGTVRPAARALLRLAWGVEPDSRGQDCVSLHRAARLAGVNRRAIQYLIRRGAIPAERSREPSHTGSLPWLISLDHLSAYRARRAAQIRGRRVQGTTH